MSTSTRPGMPTAALVGRHAVIATTPSVIFTLLAAPGEHAGLDGTGEVRGVVEGPERLGPGSVFRMRMKGYTTTNTVVEFEPDALIAWRHRGRHVWRWRLRAVPGGTEVTETFDYTAKRARRLVELTGVPKRAGTAMDRTLTALRARFV
ncbi:SRPBCC family protein [Streptomyces uncialis]|uniref:SRPBCC family protein n=1 Tax=Streptomyces uncialis TaxID=1048205 RepID=UPI00382E1B1C